MHGDSTIDEHFGRNGTKNELKHGADIHLIQSGMPRRIIINEIYYWWRNCRPGILITRMNFCSRQFSLLLGIFHLNGRCCPSTLQLRVSHVWRAAKGKDRSFHQKYTVYSNWSNIDPLPFEIAFEWLRSFNGRSFEGSIQSSYQLARLWRAEWMSRLERTHKYDKITPNIQDHIWKAASYNTEPSPW